MWHPKKKTSQLVQNHWSMQSIGPRFPFITNNLMKKVHKTIGMVKWLI